jgi:hypothetical protein
LDSAVARLVVLAALFGATAGSALAQTPAPSKRILTCKDKSGQVLITDPADPRCYAPPKTPDEQALDDARRQKAKDAYLKCKAEERSNQSLVSRYPNKDKHDAARRQALSEVDTSLRLSQARLEQLTNERQKLRDEAEFYPKGNLPPRLRRDIDSNGALIEAQTEAIATQKDTAAQKNAFYDDELGALKKLWVPQAERRGCAFPQD